MRYPWLFVGAKVVALGKIVGGYGDEAKPEAGGVYTVRGVVDRPTGLGVLLVEIVNPERLYREGYNEPDFSVLCFAPVLPSTDHIIEQLKASLPKRGRVDA